MEEIKNILEEANKLFRNSDHMAYMTYSLVKSDKLLIRIAENLYNSLTKFMEAVLRYDMEYKRIRPYSGVFEDRIDIFEHKCAVRYGFSKDIILLLKELHELISLRKERGMEFVRKNKYFVSDRDYRMKSIDIDQLKKYINKGRVFVKKVNSIFAE